MDPNQQPQPFNQPNNQGQDPQPLPQPEAPQPLAFETPQPQPVGQSAEAPAPQSVFPAQGEVAPANTSQPMSGENPGQTLGIISIILSVVGLSLVGLILGVISRKKSKEAGAPMTLGTIGMVLGIVFTIIGFFFFSLIALTTYAGIQEAAREDSETSTTSQTYYE